MTSELPRICVDSYGRNKSCYNADCPYSALHYGGLYDWYITNRYSVQCPGKKEEVKE